MNNTDRLASIDDLFRHVPKFDCKPGCADCCGPVIMSRLELKRICDRTGIKPEALDFVTVLQGDGQTCPLLDKVTNRCTVYDIRPAICKVFGSSEHHRLHCPHGLGPSIRLPADATNALMDKAKEYGHGYPPHSFPIATALAQESAAKGLQ